MWAHSCSKVISFREPRVSLTSFGHPNVDKDLKLNKKVKLSSVHLSFYTPKSREEVKSKLGALAMASSFLFSATNISIVMYEPSTPL